MAKAIETLSIELKFKDAGSQAIIEKLRGSLKRLEMGATGARPRIMGLRKEILAQGNASAKTISNITAQKTALEALRNEARVGGKAFNRLTEDIKKLDAQMGSTGKRSQARGGTRQATQIAGAVVSGGIFGGPEGALGAIGGAALGGVEGAFAGAAIGAQLKAIRDLTSEATAYAAQVQKLDIALKGVAGKQDEYSSAIATARQVTERLNVPQLDAVRGITRLTAAVKGAGGPIQDAETTFANVTAAIKATGGSTEDVRGAITAMVQVFSKGKVSAEELSGQLGERLPGAVTMFAKANNMTLPQLQENLKKGTVGLNELMRFIEELGSTYNSTASQIANSNAEAGARLAVAVQDMQAQVGAALVPIGAQFQEAFAEFVVEITPFLVENLPKLGDLFLTLAKNLDTVAVAALAALAVLAPVKIAAIIAGIGGIGKALFALKAKLIGIGLLNPFTALAAGVGLFAAAVFNASKEQARLNSLIKEGTVAQVDAEISALRSRQAELEPTAYSGVTITRQGETLDAPNVAAAKNELRKIKSALIQLEERRRTAQIDATQGAALDPSLLRPFNYKTPGAGETEGKGAKDISKAEADARIALLQIRKEDILGQEKQIRNAAELARIAAAGLPPERERVRLAEINKREKDQILALENKVNAAVTQMTEDIIRQNELRRTTNQELQQSLATRKLELGLITQEEFNQLEILRERQRLEALQSKGLISEDTIEEQMKVFKQLINQTPIDKFIKDAKASLVDLQQVAINVAQGIGNAVGSALTNGITSLIEGTKNAKEVFADFLKSVGQILAQEGARMIATYIAIGIAKAFAGLAGGGSKPDIHGANVTEVLNAGDLYNPSNSVFARPMANGGPVRGGQPYMVGERGPELFIPGSNGGIMRNEDMRRLMGRSPAGAGSQPSMNFTFETTNIGGTEYVSREQLESAMAATRRQAASDGAKRGMNMTLDRMQNSPRTRARVGIS